ncbi:4475_t:CDS:2, partial [Acaulospora morrowiae]
MDVEKASENEKLSLLAQIHEVETEIDDLQKRINQVRQRGQNRSNQVQTSIIERLIDINNRSFKLEFSRLLHNESGSRSKCDFDQNSDSTIKRLATYTKVRFINVNNHLIGSNTEGEITRRSPQN